jgi:hypothetical protein
MLVVAMGYVVVGLVVAAMALAGCGGNSGAAMPRTGKAPATSRHPSAAPSSSRSTSFASASTGTTTTCVLARTRGDFDRDGTSDAAALVALVPAGTGCRERDLASLRPRYHVHVRFGSGGGVDRRLRRCGHGPCDLTPGQLFAATDLDGDGRDELAVQELPGAVIQTVGLFRVTRQDIHPLQIARKRAARAHVNPGPAIVGGNFDATLRNPVLCRVRPDGSRVLVQMQAEMVGEKIDGPWRIERADLKLRDDTLHVVRISTRRTSHGYHGPHQPFQVGCQ